MERSKELQFILRCYRNTFLYSVETLEEQDIFFSAVPQLTLQSQDNFLIVYKWILFHGLNSLGVHILPTYKVTPHEYLYPNTDIPKGFAEILVKEKQH